mmetsp:Transcript_37474/g.98291  ORF Transcript_37474/g.98291 Transcript_37474/m.98291 type:complete len:972 (+) Transcript_37474:194-3109(+)
MSAAAARLSAGRRPSARPHRDTRMARLDEYVVGQASEATYLNATGRGVVHLDGLDRLPRVETVILRQNAIASLSGLGACCELWTVDLASNRISDLSGLEKFSALGHLDLSGNGVTWEELFKIKHIHLLSLTLTGNPVERDDKYRHHVIDILPKLWSLDGVLITGAERARVRTYFASVATNPKLRRRHPRISYTPTSMRNVALTGVHGTKTAELSRAFPLTLAHTTELDARRLMHLCTELENKLFVATSYRRDARHPKKLICTPPAHAVTLRPVLKLRADRRNMLYFLMVCSMVYAIPADLLCGTLKLTGIGDDVEGLFFLPLQLRANFAALLGASADLSIGKPHEESLYPQLRRCLKHFTSRVLRASSASPRRQASGRPSAARSGRFSLEGGMSASSRGRIMPRALSAPAAPARPPVSEERFGNLLAVELGQLLCLVPEFPACIGRDGDGGLIKILEECTEDVHIYAKLMALIAVSSSDHVGAGPAASPTSSAEELAASGGLAKVAPFLMERIHKDAVAAGELLGMTVGLPSRRGTSGGRSRMSITRGGSASPGGLADRQARGSSASYRRSSDYFRIGETVYTPSGQTARIIAMPTATMVHLHFNPFTAPFKAQSSGPSFEQVHRSWLSRDSRGRVRLTYAQKASETSPRADSARYRPPPSQFDEAQQLQPHNDDATIHQSSRVPAAAAAAAASSDQWDFDLASGAEVVMAEAPAPASPGDEGDDGDLSDEILYVQGESPSPTSSPESRQSTDGYDGSPVSPRVESTSPTHLEDSFVAGLSRPTSARMSRPGSAKSVSTIADGDFTSFSGVSVQVTRSPVAKEPSSIQSERRRSSLVPSVVSLSDADIPGTRRSSAARRERTSPAAGASSPPGGADRSSPVAASPSEPGPASPSPPTSPDPAFSTSPRKPDKLLFRGTWDAKKAAARRPPSAGSPFRRPRSSRGRPETHRVFDPAEARMRPGITIHGAGLK